MNIASLIKKSADAGVYLFVQEGRLGFKLSVEVFPAEIKAEVIAHKAAIIEFLSTDNEDAGTALERPALTVRPQTSAPIQASFAQSRLWFIDQLEQHSGQYNMPLALRVYGPFDCAIAQRALNQIIMRHEALRTHFGQSDAQPDTASDEKTAQLGPHLLIRNEVSFTLDRYDLTALDAKQQAQKIDELVPKYTSEPFDLRHDLLVRAAFISIKQSPVAEGILLFNVHHIICDGWSMAILTDEFMALYQSMVQGLTASLQPLTVQYADYAYWQRNWLQGEVLSQQLDYWQKTLEGAPFCHQLPLDRARSDLPKVGGVVQSQLDAEVFVQVKHLMKTTGCSLFMVMQAALAVLIGRLSHMTDCVLGAPTAGRSDKQLEPLIGLFVGIQLFRTDFSDNPDALTLLRTTRKQHLESAKYNEVPFEAIVERLNPERSASVSPIFQVLINLDNIDSASGANAQNQSSESGENSQANRLSFEPYLTGTPENKYDITLYIHESNDGNASALDFGWAFDTRIFNQSTMALLAQEFNHLLHQMAAKPTLPVQSYGWKNHAQRLVGQAVADRRSIAAMFEAQCAIKPDAIALIMDDGQQDIVFNSNLTYQQLNQRVNQLTGELSALIGTNSNSENIRVAVATQRNEHHIVAMLALVKLGLCYVPLSEEMPDKRLQTMLNEAKVDVILHDSGFMEQKPWLADGHGMKMGALMLLIEQCTAATVDDLPVDNPPLKTVSDTAEANIIFTSGSTGLPKGVVGNYQATQNRVSWMLEQVPFESDEISAHITDFAFIVSIWEVLVPLCGGATLLVCSRDRVKASEDLLHYLTTQKVTRFKATPSLLNTLVHSSSAKTNSIKHCFIGGERLTQQEARQLMGVFANAQLYNLYGSTEVMADASCALLREDSDGIYASVGSALTGVEVAVLDQHNRPVPDNVVGEIVVFGVGIANGYVGQHSEDNSPFITVDNRKGYRTGDLGYIGSDNELRCMGRIDEQVQVRGYRVELAEIQFQLNQCEGVATAVVTSTTASSGFVQINAYVVMDDANQAGDEQPADFIAQIRQTLAASLPSYMLPSRYMVLDALPLTVNGKVNKSRLPKPDNRLVQQRYVAPQNPMQQQLSQIWATLLDMESEHISITADFFALGGHSLLMLKLVDMVNQQLAANITLKDVFEYTSIETMAERIEHSQSDKVADHSSGIYSVVKLNASQSPIQLFMVHPITGFVNGYMDFASALSDVATVYGVQAAYCYQHELRYQSLTQLAEFYAEGILLTQAQGPYYLAGWSAGAGIVMHIAQAIERRGHRVNYVGLLEPPPILNDAKPDFIAALKYTIQLTLDGADIDIDELMAPVADCQPESAQAEIESLQLMSNAVADLAIEGLTDIDINLLYFKGGVDYWTSDRQINGVISAANVRLFTTDMYMGDEFSDYLSMWDEIFEAQIERTRISGEHSKMMVDEGLEQILEVLQQDLRAFSQAEPNKIKQQQDI